MPNNGNAPSPDGDGGGAEGEGRPGSDVRREGAVFDFLEIADSIYDGIYIADGTGRTLYVNRSYSRITGLRPDDVVGKNVQDLVAAGVYKNAVTPEVIRLKKQVNAVGESARNGARMLITGNPILDQHGNVKLVVVIEREITDLLDMQAELDATQEKMKAVEVDRRRDCRELEHLRKQVASSNQLIGSSSAISNILQMVHQIAGFDVTVLIHGETGVGKEVVANEIFLNGLRKDKPFIKVNCAAIPANLLEAELFGYEKGAFTGAATTGRLGLFELADKGTLLLDEIGELPLDLQSKLLRAIQTKEITRVGGSKPIRLDTRILAATNVDLRELVKQGRFREDLFYRLSVFPIHIPPLRARIDDLEALTWHFLGVYNSKYGKAIRIDAAAMELMRRYRWPGNARELQNIIERLVLVSDPGSIVGDEQLAALLNIGDELGPGLDPARGLKEIVDEVEKRAIEKALTQCGSTRKAAHLLGVDQSTIVKKVKRLGIRLPMHSGIGADAERHHN
ncbi:MAG TPA: sigma 54-interacting transcriptional regulator [Azospirillum sp.]|nr:sigma 54-interacting transcriptional regulator [Azospirillum sp.]